MFMKYLKIYAGNFVKWCAWKLFPPADKLMVGLFLDLLSHASMKCVNPIWPPYEKLFFDQSRKEACISYIFQKFQKIDY